MTHIYCVWLAVWRPYLFSVSLKSFSSCIEVLDLGTCASFAIDCVLIPNKTFWSMPSDFMPLEQESLYLQLMDSLFRTVAVPTEVFVKFVSFGPYSCHHVVDSDFL